MTDDTERIHALRGVQGVIEEKSPETRVPDGETKRARLGTVRFWNRPAGRKLERRGAFIPGLAPLLDFGITVDQKEVSLFVRIEISNRGLERIRLGRVHGVGIETRSRHAHPHRIHSKSRRKIAVRGLETIVLRTPEA